MTLEEVRKKKRSIEESLNQYNKTINELTIEYIELNGMEKLLEAKNG